MQYYTRQQLQGSVRYQPKVLIGNWNEDRCVQETVCKDFLAKSDSKSLKIDQCAAPYALFPARQTPTPSPVGCPIRSRLPARGPAIIK